MDFPLEEALRAERRQVVATLRSLTPEELEDGRTLCGAWAPRDVLAHLLGIDERFSDYLRVGGWVNAGNARIVATYRGWSHERLLDRADHWAEHIAPTTRPVAFLYLGDCAVHHQDVLRGLGRSREIPEASRAAILREGLILGPRRWFGRRLVPTDGGRPIGFGSEVRGTREALGLWLAGRSGLEPELEGV